MRRLRIEESVIPRRYNLWYSEFYNGMVEWTFIARGQWSDVMIIASAIRQMAENPSETALEN